MSDERSAAAVDFRFVFLPSRRVGRPTYRLSFITVYLKVISTVAFLMSS